MLVFCTHPRAISPTLAITPIPARNILGKWSKGGIPTGFAVVWGYREKTAAERARACPQLPKIQFRRAGNTPAAHAEYAHRILGGGHGVGANGATAKEGAT